jgi:holliday junction DNA helicase RuvA
MIGFLKGTLVRKQPPSLTIDVGGVGYELDAPMSTFYQLPSVGKPLTLVTHLLVREDAHVLYGFSSESERQLFRSLIKVTGVGARTALGILSGMSAQGFYRCIEDRDLASLTRVPGIGKKTAERLILEMADKVPANGAAIGFSEGAPSGAEGEAHGALLALGYKPAEVSRMLKSLDVANLSAEQLIREALRQVHT